MEYTRLGATGLSVSRICLGMMSYGSPTWREWVLDADDAVVQAVADVAKARGLRPAQVALAWVLQREAVTAPIIGATKPGHVVDASSALDVELDEDEVAALLRAPVVLVVDTRGQSRSLAALLHGFRSFDPTVDLAGVVLNRVGSPRHEEVLRAAAAEVGLPVLGALPRREALAVPSRHLGLVTAAEHGSASTSTRSWRWPARCRRAPRGRPTSATVGTAVNGLGPRPG